MLGKGGTNLTPNGKSTFGYIWHRSGIDYIHVMRMLRFYSFLVDHWDLLGASMD